MHEEMERQRAVDRECTEAVESALAAVTRLVVVKDGAYTERWADSWRVLIQDGGRTAKFFATGDGAGAIADRSEGLGAALGVSSDEAQRFAEAVAESEGDPARFGRHER